MPENKIIAQIRNELLLWNRKYPIDLYWRNKYKIPFGSKAHLEASFIDMRIDYEEEIMLLESVEKDNKKDSGEEEIDRLLNLPTIQKMSAKEVDDAFDDLDLTKFSAESKGEDEKIPL